VRTAVRGIDRILRDLKNSRVKPSLDIYHRAVQIAGRTGGSARINGYLKAALADGLFPSTDTFNLAIKVWRDTP